mgnify:FL=1
MSTTATKTARAFVRQTARPRIVSVEDEEDVQTILRQWLTPYYDLILLPHGEDLVEEVQLLQPDLIMLDIGLPGPDGLRLCQRLRRETRLGTVPILIFSGHKDDESFLSSIEAGASSFLTKPVEKEDLLARVTELLER